MVLINNMQIFMLGRMPSPIGDVLTVVDRDGVLVAVDFHDYARRLHQLLRRYHGDFEIVEREAPVAVAAAFGAYFAGGFAALARLPWRSGGTEFQRTVWSALGDIPAGETMAYAGLAARIGRASAVRAVGAANGANPLSILVPCHRLIGADGGLTGYGGGLWRKEWLLRHERVNRKISVK